MEKRRCFLFLVLLMLTSGCASHVNVPAVNLNFSPPVMHKIPLKVVVVVPERTAVFSTNTQGIATTVPAGEHLNRFSQALFPHIFREAQVTTYRTYPPGIDAAVIPSIVDVRFVPEQVALGFGMQYSAEVALKGLVTDEKGVPLWEQVVNGANTSRSVVSPYIPYEQLMGESFSEAVADAFRKLAVEMEHSRDLRSYSSAKATPAPLQPVAQVMKKPPSPKPEIRSEEPNLLPSRPGTYAVVIGIDYKGRQDIPNLLYASQDAKKVYDLLTDSRYGGVPKENALLLLNEHATRNGMVAALRKIKSWDGYIYLYYSGHGAPKVMGEQLTDAYLVPSDAVITDPEAMDDTSIKVSYLQELVDSSKAKGVLVALDACFTGGGKSIMPKGGKPLVGMLVSPEMIMPKGTGRIIVTSSAMNQQSWEDDAELKGGIFTHYLLEGLRGKAGRDMWIKADEIAEFITSNVPPAARKLKGQEQQPQVRGKADFIVTRNWDKARVMDTEIAKSTLKAAFEKGYISTEQLSRGVGELKAPVRTKTLGAFLEGKIDGRKFGELY